MSRAELRTSGRTVIITLMAIGAALFGVWWTIAHRGDQNDEIRVQGIGARLATPDVVWPDGQPQGGREATPWAQAVRQWHLAYAVAYNNRDVSDATFAQLYPADLRQKLAEEILADVGAGEFATTYYIGPLPVIVTDVSVEQADHRATVTTCGYGGPWDAYDADEAAERMDFVGGASFGTVIQNTVEKQVDGSYMVIGRKRPENHSCRLDGVKRAYFDPAPPFRAITAPWEVIGANGLPLVDTNGQPFPVNQGLDEAISQLAKRGSHVIPEDITTSTADLALDAGHARITEKASGAWATCVLGCRGSERRHPEGAARDALTLNVATWAEQLQVPEVENHGGNYDAYAKDVLSDVNELFSQFGTYAEQGSRDE